MESPERDTVPRCARLRQAVEQALEAPQERENKAFAFTLAASRIPSAWPAGRPENGQAGTPI